VASPVEDYTIACTADTGGFDPTEQHMAHIISSETLLALSLVSDALG